MASREGFNMAKKAKKGGLGGALGGGFKINKLGGGKLPGAFPRPKKSKKNKWP
jgi:hypothetical protein